LFTADPRCGEAPKNPALNPGHDILLEREFIPQNRNIFVRGVAVPPNSARRGLPNSLDDL
jgi:hypothetical protein